MTALRPEPQTLLMVRAPTVSGTPAANATCRAGFCPSPAESTLPKMTSSISDASIPAREMASLAAKAPISGAEREAKLPWKVAMGVRQALAMTTSFTEGRIGRGTFGANSIGTPLGRS